MRELEQQRAAMMAAVTPDAPAVTPDAPAEAPDAAAPGFVESDPSTWGNPGRNGLCPCGSGKKFKHCHGRLA